MVLAEVVSLFASTNSTSVAAYAIATSPVRSRAPPVPSRRASGKNTQIASAATSDRNPATCQLLNAADLMAAPPVENSKAAPRICIRGQALDIAAESPAAARDASPRHALNVRNG